MQWEPHKIFFTKTSYTITNQRTKLNEILHTPMWTALHDSHQDWMLNRNLIKITG